MITRRHAILVLSLVTLAACAPSLIPGTTIPKTADNEAILDVLRRYKNAFEARDAESIAALASDRYLDERSSTSKDVLANKLKDELARTKDLRLDIQVRRIDVERDRATVDYFYALAFLVDTTTAEWQRESDEKRMTLVREQDGWKVLNGF